MSKNNTKLEYLGVNFIDDRGSTKFINDFNFLDFEIKRFYIIENFTNNFIRAWHAHKDETKAALCIQGAVMLCRVKLDDFNIPSKNLDIEKFTLECTQPKIIIIPKGYANGVMNLKPDSKIMFFSDKTLKDSANDDYRFEYNYWNPWKVNFR
ncbi:WxcM-like domain-containing protein [Alphaproteobacteria bacterium]|nr:WxcM-like domain-containing protein [Alphaproteobacteria bacterium]